MNEPRWRAAIRDPRVLLAVYLLTLALIAFWPEPVDRGVAGLLGLLTNWLPVLTYPRIEFLANIVLFVPFGWLLTLILRGQRHLVLPISFVSTVAIECGQAVMLAQRTPSLRDIVANTAGACVGLLIAATIDAARTRRRQLDTVES